jgi:hypothetical protein
MQRRSKTPAAICLALLAFAASPAALAETGKLKLTGGVSSVDGAAGGGITPWALIGTNATTGEWGVSAFASHANTQDYKLNVLGAAFAWNDRVELSHAQQSFDTGPTGRALGLPGLKLKQSITGVKVKVLGNAVLDADTPMPQVSVGLLNKSVDSGGLKPTLTALGAKTSDTELYVSATKLLLAQGVLVNATLRNTRANQNGLLGFGSARGSGKRWLPEVSVAKLLSPSLAVGLEYRKKPDNLNQILGPGVLAEQSWKDLFVAWAPSKNMSVTAAYLDLGQIAPPFVSAKQTGWYLSAQVAY